MADTTAGGGLQIPIRTLFISTAFSILVSLTVFAVSSMLFVFPVIASQGEQISALHERVKELQVQVADLPAPSPAPAPSAAVAPAPTPVAVAPAAK